MSYLPLQSSDSRIRRHPRAVGLLALAAAAAAFAGSLVAAPPVATVNGEPIAARELKRAMDTFVAGGSMNAGGGIFNPGVYERARRQQLDKLIDQELLWQAAREADLLPTEGEVIEAMQHQRAEYPNQQSFELALETQGLSLEEFRQRVRRQLAGAKLLARDVYGRIEISDQEVREFYRQNEAELRGSERLRLRQILLAVPMSASAEAARAAQARAREALERIRGGEDFAAVARELSDGAHAARGGDMGAVTRQQLPVALQGPLHHVEVGEIKGPLRSEQGIHLIRVEGREPGELPPLEVAAEPIRRYLVRQRGEAEAEEYVQQLRAEADVQVNLR